MEFHTIGYGFRTICPVFFGNMVVKPYLYTIKSVKLNKIGVLADLVDEFWFGEYKKYLYLCSK